MKLQLGKELALFLDIFVTAGAYIVSMPCFTSGHQTNKWTIHKNCDVVVPTRQCVRAWHVLDFLRTSKLCALHSKKYTIAHSPYNLTMCLIVWQGSIQDLILVHRGAEQRSSNGQYSSEKLERDITTLRRFK